MKYNASTDAAIAKRTPYGCRLWTDSAFSFVVEDQFEDGYLHCQKVYISDSKYFQAHLRTLTNDTAGYTPWRW